MSQYPQNPQLPYGTGMGPAADPQAPARRAAILMNILGALGVLTGVCCMGVAFMPLEQVMAQQGQLPKLPPGVTLAEVMIALRVIGGVVVAGSLVEFALGFFVRSGNSWPIIAAMVLTLIGIVVLGIYAVGVILVNGGAAVPAMLLCLIVITVFVAQFVLLLQARAAAATVEQGRLQYQAQYWQYLQYQQAFQQPAPLPPPPGAYPPSPPPPAGGGYPGAGGFGQSAYNAPPAGSSAAGGAATGWQWPATQPPPPPPPAATPEQPQGDASHGEGSPQG